MKWFLVVLSVGASFVLFGVVIAIGLGWIGDGARERCMSSLPGDTVTAEVERFPPKLTCRSGDRIVVIDETSRFVALAVPALLPAAAVLGAIHRSRRPVDGRSTG